MKKISIVVSITALLIACSTVFAATNTFIVRNNAMWDYCGPGAGVSGAQCKYYVKVDGKIMAESATYNHNDYDTQTQVKFSSQQAITVSVGRHMVNPTTKSWDQELGSCTIQPLSSQEKGLKATCKGYCDLNDNRILQIDGQWEILPFYNPNEGGLTCSPTFYPPSTR